MVLIEAFGSKISKQEVIATVSMMPVMQLENTVRK